MVGGRTFLTLDRASFRGDHLAWSVDDFSFVFLAHLYCFFVRQLQVTRFFEVVDENAQICDLDRCAGLVFGHGVVFAAELLPHLQTLSRHRPFLRLPPRASLLRFDVQIGVFSGLGRICL